jgi:thioredoxin reductase (NADPH)
MISALENFRGRFSLAFEIEVVDIDQQPQLESRWGDKVPVLLDGDKEICHYFIDEETLRRTFAPG